MRDGTHHYDQQEPRQRPTFHEVRGLGSRLYEARGVPRNEIQALMTHSSAKTTKIYLEGGAQGLTIDDYVAVQAPLTVKELIGDLGQAGDRPAL